MQMWPNIGCKTVNQRYVNKWVLALKHTLLNFEGNLREGLYDFFVEQVFMIESKCYGILNYGYQCY